MTTPPCISIRYHRPPDRLQVFTQAVLQASDECVVTFMHDSDIKKPIQIQNQTIMEPGSPVVWFTYPGRWHDLGMFHLSDGTFTGTYANILTPVQTLGRVWETTDLFLDVWVPANGPARLLDRDEFDAAIAHGWIDGQTADRALLEAEELLAAAGRGDWPPRPLAEWSLERAREKAAELQPPAEESAGDV